MKAFFCNLQNLALYITCAEKTTVSCQYREHIRQMEEPKTRDENKTFNGKILKQVTRLQLLKKIRSYRDFGGIG